MKKRVLTTVLALCVMFTSIPVDGVVYAQEVQSQSTEMASELVTGNTEQMNISGNAENTAEPGNVESQENAGDTESVGGTESTESGEVTEGTESTESGEVTEGTESTESGEVPEGTENTENTENTEGTESGGVPEGAENTEGTESGEVPEGIEDTEESTEIAEGTEDVENTELVEGTEGIEGTEESTEIAEDTEDAEEEAAKLNYIMVESEYLETPATQNIVASIGTEDMELKDIRLVYKNLTSGETFITPVSAKAEDMLLFSVNYADESQSGVYQLTAFLYTYDGEEIKLSLKELDMDVRYGVNMDADAAPDQLLQDVDTLEEQQAELEASVVTIDEKGNVTSEGTVEDVLTAGSVMSALEDGIKGANGKLVVMLDPGHDATHAGAHQNGGAEEELVFKIASYCKEELETYSGITVYMTRSTTACPNGGSAVTSGTCNEKRVELAAAVGAQVYVSFHLNSNTDSSPHGVGVYYPNSNYNAQIGQVGQGLAQQILAKLRALGLAQWATGTIIWNASVDKYPDGSAADYLGVIRNCKKVGIPAVLIEHAFISNYSDYVNYLSTEEQLKKLGVADAQAIAETYALTKGANRPVIEYAQSKADSTLKLKWKSKENVSYYEVYRSRKKDTDYALLANVQGENFYIDETAEEGQRYYYVVRAVYANYTASELSDPVAGRVLGKAEISYIQSKSSKKLQIGWEKVTGAEGYYIYRQNAATGKYEKIDTLISADTLIYVDSVASNNKEYAYKVKAYNTSNRMTGVGPYSDRIAGKSVGKSKVLSVEAINYKTLELTWKKVSGASGYEIARSTDKNGTYKKIATISSGNITTYQDDTVTAGKIYYYKIQAVNKNNGKKGVSGYSAAVSGKTVARTSITSVNSKDSDTIVIKWKKIDGAYGYRVKRSTSKNGTYKVIETIKNAKTTSYQDKKIETGRTYYYKVETLSKNGDVIGSSGESTVVKGRTIAKTAINYVVSQDSTTIQINWNSVDDAWGYRIKRSTSKNGTYKTIKTMEGGDKTTYKDKSVKTSKKYYYKVEAINMVNKVKGYSGDSAAVAGKTLAKTSVTKVKAENSNQIRIDWKKVSDASGYQIYRSTSKNGTYKKIAQVTGEKTTRYQDDSVSAGKTYYYKVRAYKENSKKSGLGSFTSPQKAWTLAKVTISKAVEKDGTYVTLNWEKVAKADGYRIYRSTRSDGGFKMVKEISSGEKISYKDSTVKKGKVYYYRVAAINKTKGNTVGRGNYSAVLKVPVLADVKITETSIQEKNAILLTWNSAKNADGYQLSYSEKKNGTYKTVVKTDKLACNHYNLKPGKNYYYKVRAYTKLSNGSTAYGAWSTVVTVTTGYEIMGESSITVEQMVAYYNSKNYSYPAEVYKTKGAADVQTFFEILKKEADAEGVRAEVLFAQVMLETGGLQFGGDVKPVQCNFGGLGATGNGVSGETFANVQTGLRAQVQHLKAYASTAPLNNKCVDARFQYVSRGCAPYIEWLSIPNNPQGKGWATDPNYGTKLLAIIEAVK